MSICYKSHYIVGITHEVINHYNLPYGYNQQQYGTHTDNDTADSIANTYTFHQVSQVIPNLSTADYIANTC